MTTRLSNAITMQTRNSGSSCDNERTSRFRTATTRQSVRSVSVSMRPLAKSLWTLAVITALLVQNAGGSGEGLARMNVCKSEL